MDIPKEVDCIVIGTGLVESLVAAACARVGKSVIHVDRNQFYGGNWAALSLDDFQNGKEEFEGDHAIGPQLSNIDVWDSGMEIPRRRAVLVDLSPKLCFSKGKLVQLLVSSNSARYLDFKEVSSMHRNDGSITSVPCTKASLMRNKTISPMEKRRLVKYLQYCLEHAKYAQSQQHQNETNQQQKGEEKNEEKQRASNSRHAQKQTSTAPIPDVSFEVLLSKDFKLNKNLQEYVISSMTWLDGSVPAKVGVERTGLFLTSMNVFCPSPLLYPMYGSGEFSQAFSRLCAVFGGMYVLCQNDIELHVDGTSNSIHSVSTGALGDVKAKNVVAPLPCCALVDTKLAPTSITAATTTQQQQENGVSTTMISRASLLIKTDSIPYVEDDGGCCAVVTVPPASCEGLKSPCRAIVLTHRSGVCPKGYAMCHLTTTGLDENTFTVVLQRAMSLLFPAMIVKASTEDNFDTNIEDDGDETEVADSPSMHLVWRVFFQQLGLDNSPNTEHTVSVNGLFATSGLSDASIGFDLAVEEAEVLFSRIYPGEDFLPRAPDYDEIVFDFGDEEQDEAKNDQDEECALKTTSCGTTYLPISAYKKTENGYVLRESAHYRASTYLTTSVGTKYLPISAYMQTPDGLVLRSSTDCETSGEEQVASVVNTDPPSSSTATTATETRANTTRPVEKTQIKSPVVCTTSFGTTYYSFQVYARNASTGVYSLHPSLHSSNA
eukprot:m.41937 g.41937  ORF g.41937 m.41937 type:complete len:718 (-) comp10474_c0_seq2:62-2215(-)